MIYSQLIDIACYFNSSFEETFTQYRSPPFRWGRREGWEFTYGIYNDLKSHDGLENASLLLVQSQIDNTSLCPFITAMNQLILDLSKISSPRDLELLKQ